MNISAHSESKYSNIKEFIYLALYQFTCVFIVTNNHGDAILVVYIARKQSLVLCRAVSWGTA